MLIRRATSFAVRALRQTALQVRYARRWQSHSLKTSTPTSKLHYENFYDRLLTTYGSEGGRISVSKFLEVRYKILRVVTSPRLIDEWISRTLKRLALRRATLGSSQSSRGYKPTPFNSTAAKKPNTSLSSKSSPSRKWSGVCEGSVHVMCWTHMIYSNNNIYCHNTPIRCSAVSSNVLLLEKALNGKLIIPAFHTFRETINSIYYDCLSIRGGEVITIISTLPNNIPPVPSKFFIVYYSFRMPLTSPNCHV